MSFLSFAQNFEDVLLHRVFGGQETGFYVDVGAFHPIIGSTTKSFYDRGWSGINIEPGSVYTELAADRPRDINLQMAVFDRAGEITFVEDEGDRGTSFVSESEVDRPTARTVPCDTLEGIVRTYSRNRPIDFIKIDAEGAEGAIVRSTNWRTLRPHVLLLEATRIWSSVLCNQDWEPYLLEQGYIRVYFDGVNCFYIPEEAAPFLQRHFTVPVNTLDSPIRYEEDRLRGEVRDRTHDVARLTGERDNLHVSLSDHRNALSVQTQEVARQAQEVARLVGERDVLHARLNELTQQVASLTGERDDLHRALEERTRAENEQKQLAARLDGEKTALETAFRASQDEVARASAQRSDLQAEIARLLQPPPSPQATPQAAAARGATRRAAKGAYMLVRPIVRPIVWRLRSFMTGGITEQLSLLNGRVNALATQPASHGAASSPLPIVLPAANDESIGEIRRLAVEMERVLLTLAMERGTDHWSEAKPVVTPPSTQTVS